MLSLHSYSLQHCMNVLKRIKRYLALHFSISKDQRKRIISFWEKGGPDFDYYEKAEQENWLTVFWNEQSSFYQLFQYLDLDTTLEIACGTGRHSARVIDKIKKLYLLDSSLGAIEKAKERFAAHTNIVYIHSKDGIGIPAIVPDGSLTSVFSYDAMVHFEKETVFSYVEDSFRKLKDGAYALYHHSNYGGNPGGKFTDNPGWRNFMTQELFLNKAAETGFEVVQSEIISFSCEDSDCITLLKKPVLPGKG